MTMERAEEQNQAGAGTPAEASQPALKPGGIGTGVAFDWALAVQLLINAIFFLLGVAAGSRVAGQPLPLRLALALGAVLGAAIVFTQGEALRRGRRVAWMIQIAANSLLVIFGLVNIPDLIPSLKAGQVSLLVEEVVLLIISPLIVWLLTRRRTRAWFASTTSAQARARHSGMWLFWMAVYAIMGGTAIAFVGYY